MSNFYRTTSLFFNNPYVNPYIATLKHIGWQFRKAMNLFPYDLTEKGFIVRIGNRVIANGCGALINAMGYYDPNNMFFLEEVYKRGVYKFFFDIGSNIGFYSLIVASQSSEAKVLAFEPHPYTYDQLRENVTINGLNGQIITINSALGSRNGGILFSNEPGSSVNRVVTFADGDAISVKVIRGDSIDLLQHKVTPEILKIDVEGYENYVLKGFGKTLGNVQVIFIECQSVGATANLLARDFGFLGPFKIDYEKRRFFNSSIHNEDWVFLNPNAKNNISKMNFYVEDVA